MWTGKMITAQFLKYMIIKNEIKAISFEIGWESWGDTLFKVSQQWKTGIIIYQKVINKWEWKAATEKEGF